MHSLETFGGGISIDADDGDDDDDQWASLYLTKPAVKPVATARALTSSTPSSDALYCRNCDRHFFTAELLQTHEDEHETCGVEGCPYTAHPKLVLNHYKTQHLTGLADKVWKVQTPEDIAKWREDRKRNFPTAARMAARKKETKERKKRGNVLNNQYFGKINGDTRGRIVQNDRGRGFGGRGLMNRGGRGGRGAMTFRSVDNEFCSDSESSSDDDAIIGGTMIKKVEEEEVEDKEKEASPASAASSTGILGGLACAYASSDDDDDDNGGVDAKKDLDTVAKEAENADQSDDIAKDTQCATDENAKVEDKLNKKKNRKRKKNKSGDQPELVQRLLTDGQVKYQLTKKRQKRDPTLLERLLAPEVRRERNIILQCVRYIVRKDFFDENA